MFTNKTSNYIASVFLVIMFFLLFFSARNDSSTMDELAHIPSGYSYLTQKDMRLNPEHPPLIKDLSAVPLLFLDLNFPVNHTSWTEDVNGQWTSGSVFLYESGNDADKILKFSRLPIMLLAILFGVLLFLWVRGLYGNKTALLTLFFYAFSPTFLAHSRYVTTDLGAVFGFFIGIAAYVNFLSKENLPETRFPAKNSVFCRNKHLIIAGVAFGIAELLKFSLFLLVPFYLVYGVLWAFLIQFGNNNNLGFFNKIKNFLKDYLKIFIKTLLIFIIGGLIMWIVYGYHVLNYPEERQIRDIEFNLSSFGNEKLVDLTVWMAETNILRPLAQYLLGLLMVVQRANGGNTTYFMGEVAVNGWWQYFPTAYILKENLAFHILTIFSLILAVYAIFKSKNKSLTSIFKWLKDNFALTAGIIFIIIYWAQSISSPLNIGLRHVLPTFPFIYLLVSRKIVLWLDGSNKFNFSGNFIQKILYIYNAYLKPAPRYLVLFVFLFWIFLSAVFSFPYYVSYYNELAGGTKNGYKYITDSNYDWGQDLKRLKDYTEKNNIPEIYIDYFGGGSPSYYFGNKFKGWNAEKGIPPSGSYLAVSATFLQGSIAKPADGIIVDKEKTYYWLKSKEMEGRGGVSIFVYKIQN